MEDNVSVQKLWFKAGSFKLHNQVKFLAPRVKLTEGKWILNESSYICISNHTFHLPLNKPCGRGTGEDRVRMGEERNAKSPLLV